VAGRVSEEERELEASREQVGAVSLQRQRGRLHPPPHRAAAAPRRRAQGVCLRACAHARMRACVHVCRCTCRTGARRAHPFPSCVCSGCPRPAARAAHRPARCIHSVLVCHAHTHTCAHAHAEATRRQRGLGRAIGHGPCIKRARARLAHPATREMCRTEAHGCGAMDAPQQNVAARPLSLCVCVSEGGDSCCAQFAQYTRRLT
jgi:hypothetical protein